MSYGERLNKCIKYIYHKKAPKTYIVLFTLIA